MIAHRNRASLRLLTVAALWLELLGAAGPAWAIDSVFNEGGVAIRGYDAVAYFTQGEAVEGNAQFAADYGGVEWRFASAAHRDQFAAEPAKFAPQYGGYCAWAVANNYTAPIDPDAWTIKDGKLYLNYSKFVRTRWALDKSGNIAKADANWPALRDAK